MAGLKKEIGYPWIHLESMRGSVTQNERYCSKESELIRFGLPFIGKGGRRDAQVFYGMIKEGKSQLELADHDFGMFARFLRAHDRIRLLLPTAPREEKRECILLVGKPECGKTRWVRTNYPVHFKIPLGKDIWYDGYNDEKVVVFDEFEGQMPLTDLLKILDNWEQEKVPIKGAFCKFNPDVVVIISNSHPSGWYDYSKRTDKELALRRRFTKVYSEMKEVNIKEYWPLKCDGHYHCDGNDRLFLDAPREEDPLDPGSPLVILSDDEIDVIIPPSLDLGSL